MQIVQIVRPGNTGTNGNASTVCEPSISNLGQEIILTGNWFAARSSDNGATWNHVDPFNFFPTADQGFCCDQTIHRDPSRDLTFWLLQYSATNAGNTLRLAVNNTPNIDDTAWYWWDLVPSQIDPAWQNEWFDYNHAALSDNFLYVVSNVFSTGANTFTRCVVFRFPLNSLANSGGDPGLEFFETDDFSLRCTQGATGTMYLATHLSDREIRLYEWAEASATPLFQDLNVSRWIGGGGGYSAPGPDGNNWLRRCDPRITGGWISDNVIGFMWSVDKTPSRPFPHVRVVRINAATGAVIDEPDIWSPSVAYAIADACPNANGTVGVTLFRGGGALHPGHVVGLWDAGSNSWTLQATENGTHGPSDKKWGDYLTCRRQDGDPDGWIAIGYTLQGGSTRANIEPCMVQFRP